MLHAGLPEVVDAEAGGEVVALEGATMPTEAGAGGALGEAAAVAGQT